MGDGTARGKGNLVNNGSDYVPARGEAVWIDLDPQTGREQQGRRPALVLSPQRYNARVGLALFCPITSRAKGYPFEVTIPVGYPVSGVILADQVKSLDWRTRKTTPIVRLPGEVTDRVIRRLQTLLVDKG
jgi:mRNA interferase MazF